MLWSLPGGENHGQVALGGARRGAAPIRRLLATASPSQGWGTCVPRRILKANGIRAPNCNVYAARFVLTVKSACLGKVILFGEASLRRGRSVRRVRGPLVSSASAEQDEGQEAGHGQRSHHLDPFRFTGSRVANGPDCERSLVRRGDVTVWLSPEASAAWRPCS